jgi:hypothetical protein
VVPGGPVARPAGVKYIRQELNVIIDFLAWMAGDDRHLSDYDQATIDTWLAGGPTTRDKIRRFVTWAVKHQHIAQARHVPYRRSGPQLMMSDTERIALPQTLLDATPERRSAIGSPACSCCSTGLFIRIRRLGLDDITTTVTTPTCGSPRTRRCCRRPWPP